VVYAFSYIELGPALRVLPPAAVAWLPNVSVAAISAFLLGLSSIRRRTLSADVERF
jgi:hypothetical protein